MVFLSEVDDIDWLMLNKQFAGDFNCCYLSLVPTNENKFVI